MGRNLVAIALCLILPLAAWAAPPKVTKRPNIVTSGSDGDSSSTSSDSGLEFLGGLLALLRGCDDAQILKWEEDTDTWDCAADGGGGSGAFSDAADPIVQNTTTKDVHIGDAAGTLAGKLEIGGDADQPQVVIEGHSTQTDDIFIIQNDADSEVFSISNTGSITNISGALTDGTVVENDLTASIVFDDGDLLDFSAVNASGTGEGLHLPQGTDISSATAEGQCSWDSDDNELGCGDGSGIVPVGHFAMGGSTDTDTSAQFRIRGLGAGGQASWNTPFPTRFTGKFDGAVENVPGSGKSWTLTLDGPGTVTDACTCTIGAADNQCGTADVVCDEEGALDASMSCNFVPTGGPASSGGAGCSYAAYPTN